MTVDNHLHRRSATAWFRDVAEPGTAVFCRSTQQSFLRLLTNPSVFARYGSPPLSNAQAWDTYDALARDERVGFEPTDPLGLEAHWRQFSPRRTASTKLWMDAYLAAFAVASGLRLVTTDAAFRQFAGLDVLVLGAAAA